MFLLGVVAGLLLGLALGGRLDSLINVRLRYALLIFLALIVRYGTQLAIANGVAVADALRVRSTGRRSGSWRWPCGSTVAIRASRWWRRASP